MDNVLPAIYRTADPIDNLLVRVNLQKRIPGAGGAVPTLPGSATTSRPASLSVEIAWQQKVYSPREILLYAAAVAAKKGYGPMPPSTLLNITSPTVQEGIADIERRLDNQEDIFAFPTSTPFMIFTYVDRDGYIPPGEKEREFLDTRIGGAASTFSAAAAVASTTASAAMSYLGRNTSTNTNNNINTAAGGPGGAALALQNQPRQPGALATPGTTAITTAASSSSSSRRNSASSSSSSSPAVPSSAITAALLDPLSKPHSVAAHAYKEHPYSTMYIMAAVDIDIEAFKSRSLNTQMTEICLGSVRSYRNSTLLEMRPGFAEPVAYDKQTLTALCRSMRGETPATGALAAALLIESDIRLGSCKHGGVLRLRQLPGFTGSGGQFLSSTFTSSSSSSSSSAITPFSSSSSSADTTTVTAFSAGNNNVTTLLSSANPPIPPVEKPGAIVAYAVETHRFPSLSFTDGSVYEYSITNPDEDIETLIAISNGSSGGDAQSSSRRQRSGSSAGLLLGNGGGGIGNADENDILESIRYDEIRAIARAAHRVGSDFFSKIPRTLKYPSFRVTIYAEIVAAAGFSPLSGAQGIYIAYELVVPRGCGWRLLPDTDMPDSGIGSGGSGGGNSSSSSTGGYIDAEALAYEQENADDWDRDAFLERDEQRQEGQQHNSQLRQRRGTGTAGNNNNNNTENTTNPNGRRNSSGNTRRRRSSGGGGFQRIADPDKHSRRRWLRATPVAGVTQVARLVKRPWVFGTPAASIGTSTKTISSSSSSSSSGSAAGGGGSSGGNGGNSEEPFFALPAVGTMSGAGEGYGDGALLATGGAGGPSHPFGFGSGGGGGGGGGGGVFPGVARYKTSTSTATTASATGATSSSSKSSGVVAASASTAPYYATHQVSSMNVSHSEGVGSVSLISSVADGIAGTSGAVVSSFPTGGAGTAASYEVMKMPESSPTAYPPVATFGYPVEMHLLYDGTGTSTTPDKLPTLFFSVYSRDSWDRHRAEGYGYVDVDVLHAGSRDQVLRCWKPKGTPQQEEADFFLGGATRLADVTYTKIPSNWPAESESGVIPAYEEEGDDDDDEEEEDEEQDEDGDDIGRGAGAMSRGRGRSGGSGIVAGGAASAVLQATRTTRSTTSSSGGNALSRFGFTTVTTGEVGIRFNTILQRPPQPSARVNNHASVMSSSSTNANGGAGAGGSQNALQRSISSQNNVGSASSSSSSSTLIGGGGGRAPLTVEQIIADARTHHRKDRARREGAAAGARSPSVGSSSSGGV